jgi:hypothetical protein
MGGNSKSEMAGEETRGVGRPMCHGIVSFDMVDSYALRAYLNVA